MIEKSTITCPYCGFQKEEALPITYCLLIWKCPSRKQVVQPKKNAVSFVATVAIHVLQNKAG